MIRQAFNTLTRLHSRPAYLKRFGTPDIYTPCRITPSNYFRFLEGPGSSTIHGREFLIPYDSLLGHHTQLITFSATPDEGNFILTYDSVDTVDITSAATSDDVQTALRGIEGLESVTVEGDFEAGFIVTFIGVQNPVLLIAEVSTPPLVDEDEEEIEFTIVQSTYVPWATRLLRGDKILDTVFGNIAIDEVIEVPDIGGAIMGYRVRVE